MDAGAQLDPVLLFQTNNCWIFSNLTLFFSRHVTTRAMDREKPRMSMVDSDDDVPIFALGSKPKETKKPSRRLRAFHGKREKRVQKPTRLDKAFRMIQEGAAEIFRLVILSR